MLSRVMAQARYLRVDTALVILLRVFVLAESQRVYEVNIYTNEHAEEITAVLENSTFVDGHLHVHLKRVEDGPLTFNHSQLRALLTARSQLPYRYEVNGSEYNAEEPEQAAEFNCSSSDDVINLTVYNPSLTIWSSAISGCRLAFRGSSGPRFTGCTFRDGIPPVQPSAVASMLLYSGQTFGGEVVNNCKFTNNTIPSLVVEIDGGCCDTELGITDSSFVANTITLNESVCDARVFSSAGLQINIGPSARLPSSSSSLVRVRVGSCNFSGNSLRVPANSLCAETSAGIYAASGAALRVETRNVNIVSSETLTIADSSFSDNVLFSVNDTRPLAVDQVGAFAGGAVSIHLLDTFNFSTSIASTVFKSNTALRGGGLSVHFSGSSAGNVVTISNSSGGEKLCCEFVDNNATSCLSAPHEGGDLFSMGGGLNVEFRNTSHDNAVLVTDCMFSKNGASEGGGAHAGFYEMEQNNSFVTSRCNFTANKAITGAAIELWAGRTDGAYQVQADRNISLIESTFTSNKAYFRGAVAVTSLVIWKMGKLTFNTNINSAFFMRQSLANIRGDLVYHSNLAEVGAGIFLTTSQVRFHENSTANFTNNTAFSVGGGVFAHVETRYS